MIFILHFCKKEVLGHLDRAKHTILALFFDFFLYFKAQNSIIIQEILNYF
ncbi:hypothetical protein HMPREF9422_0826 [Streptococcus cristatus ATCC 51100]|uniref:Conserved domain protein n=1 Tax=Streptococcus cristatus ATCC 51100 TaxID=889201 RepID=A0AAV3EDK2_STRCR|nr:hypothetical protein HMPREF9422_0826 [Streptococcus cristatus ATCC 51100]EGU66840.1 conserved domain protein [Streptococcus cristatus ATCC 51100]